MSRERGLCVFTGEHRGELCKNGKIDWNAVLGLTYVGEGEILGVVWPSVCGAVCATATADCDAPDWLVSYYIVPCEKLPPPIVRCGLSSKFFDHQMYLLLDLSRTFYLLLLLRILNIFVHQCVYSNWSSNVIRWKSIRRRLAFSWRRTDLLLKRHWTVETNSMDSDFNCYLVACKSLYVLWPLFANWHCNMSSVKRFRLWLQTWNNAGDSLSFCYFCDYWGENSEEAC